MAQRGQQDDLDLMVDFTDLELDAEQVTLLKGIEKLIKHSEDAARRREEKTMGRLQAIQDDLAAAGAASASEHEQVMADLAALKGQAADLAAQVAALTADAVTQDEIDATKASADALVQSIKDIDPDAAPEPTPEPVPAPDQP